MLTVWVHARLRGAGLAPDLLKQETWHVWEPLLAKHTLGTWEKKRQGGALLSVRVGQWINRMSARGNGNCREDQIYPSKANVNSFTGGPR